MSRGVLVIVKADDCKACRDLDERGFFDDLVNNLDVENVYTLPLKKRGPSGKALIFDIDPYYPNFKFMSENTFRKCQSSGINWRPLVPYVRLFNREIHQDGSVTVINTMLRHTRQTIQDFCNAAQEELGLNDDESESLALYDDY